MLRRRRSHRLRLGVQVEHEPVTRRRVHGERVHGAPPRQTREVGAFSSSRAPHGLYTASMAGEPALDDRNAAFWDELCGTNLARELGITDVSEASLARFDEAYFDALPVPARLLPAGGRRAPAAAGDRPRLRHARRERWPDCGADYHGLDIAAAPVAMLHVPACPRPRRAARPGCAGLGARAAVRRRAPSTTWSRSAACTTPATSSAPSPNAAACCGPGGRLVLMVYNRRSARRVLLGPVLGARHRLVSGAPSAEDTLRYFYDGHADGDAAPHTDFVSVGELRGLLSGFRDVRIDRRSIDRVPLGPVEIRRQRLMRLGLDRLVGLDLYAVATADLARRCRRAHAVAACATRAAGCMRRSGRMCCACRATQASISSRFSRVQSIVRSRPSSQRHSGLEAELAARLLGAAEALARVVPVARRARARSASGCRSAR